MDKQGRFLVASNLREYAKMDKEIVVIGVGNRIEMWNKAKWNTHNSADNISADEIAEKMDFLGI